MIRHATEAGLLTPLSQGLRGAENYLLLAHAALAPRPTSDHPPVPGWRECAILPGRYQLAVASGDYGIFDAVIHQDEQAERQRVTAAAQHLTSCLRDPDTAHRVPDIAGADLVAAIGREHQDFIRHRIPRSHPHVLQDYRRELVMLINGMAQQRIDPHPTFPFEITRALSSDTLDISTAVRRVAARHRDTIPRRVLDHLTTLMAAPHPDERDQLLLLLRTAEEGNTIGVSPLYKSIALHAAPHQVPTAALPVLHQAAWLTNYWGRIANSLCELNNTALRDNPHETNPAERVWYCLLSDAPGETFTDRELPPHTAHYIERACLRAENWIARTLADILRTLWHHWPWLAAALARLTHLGTRIYDVQHYVHLSHTEFAALADELDHPDDHPFLARCNPTWKPRNS